MVFDCRDNFPMFGILQDVDIIFVRGLNATPKHLYLWPTFKQDVLNCTNCQTVQVVEIARG